MTELEELQQLRALVEQQKLELEKQQVKIEKQQTELEKKDELIRKKDIQIEHMIQALLHARKKLFGRSSEITEGQLCLFETNQELAEQLSIEQKKVAVKSYKRTPRQPGIREELLAGIPKVIEEYVIPEDDTCSVCGAPLKVIGKQIVRTEVEFIPAKVRVVQVVRQVAKCTECGIKEGSAEKEHFQKAAIPAKVLPHSIATHSLVAWIMYQKFAMGIPLHRQENDFYRMGLVLPRADMTHWVIRCSAEWLTPIYHRIHQALLSLSVLHMDETTIQCNKEEGRKASTNSYVWVMQSAACEEIRATFFHYSKSRARTVAEELLKGFSGYLITDAYQGYENIGNVKQSLCWAHLRRYFIESIPLDNKGKELLGSKGAEGREYINLLFQLEEKLKDLSKEERKEQRQSGVTALLDAFWSWVEKTRELPTTNEKLTKALNYAKNHKEGFQTFLEDGRLVISNNLIESHIRPFAVGRKAWLFADTPKGAKANAVLYTIVESARANDLDVYEYLNYLLTELPEIGYAHEKAPEILDKYLPWSDQLPEEVRLKQKRKKCVEK